MKLEQLRLGKETEMGVTLYKKKTTGNWYVWIRHKGQRTSRKVGKDYRTAKKVATLYRKKMVLGEIDYSNGRGKNRNGLLFGEFCQDYLKNVAKHRLKYNTWHTYQSLIKLYLLPAWKNKRLDSFTRQDVKDLLLQKQARGLFVQNMRICISAIFSEAVERELLAANPARNLGRVFKKGVAKTRASFLSKEQVAILLKRAEKDTPFYYDLLLTAFRTGMRLGELLALCWDSVNFDSKQICVQRSYSHCHWDTPKSHKIRYIDMSNGLHAALLKRYEKREKGLVCKIINRKKLYLVFPTIEGKPLSHDVIRRAAFYKLLAAAKLPKIRIHDIRHTYASLLLQAGAPIHYVKEQLGHSSIATTVDLYGHCQPGINRETVNRLD